MKYTSLLFILFLFSCKTTDTTSTTEIPEKAPQLHDLKFSYQIEEEMENGSLRQVSAAYYYTYIGQYQKALNTYELPLDWGLDSISQQDSMDFLDFKPVNAFNYLAERTQKEQLVIISEAHQKPQHRVFTQELLPILYQNGFRALGIEAVMPSWGDSTKYLMDTLMQKRGYPLNAFISGTYTREPRMANMIREAIALGFEIFAYERNKKGVERDLLQAQNVMKYMAAHPNKKIVLHCGWYHAIESNYPKRKSDNYLAYHLKTQTDIDPFTIYQDALDEKFLEKESPFYKMINSNEVSVLVNSKGEVFNGKKEQQHFDVLLYHPKTTYQNGRPNWLFEMDEVTAVGVKSKWLEGMTFPVIIEAYKVDDNEWATPIDRIELEKKEEKDLILKKGKYRIVVMDKMGKEKEVQIKV